MLCLIKLLLLFISFAAVFSLIAAGEVSTNETTDNETSANAAAVNPIDPEELEAFMDGAVNASLKAHHIPGATVAVVKDGRIIFSKGYGYADIDERKPVLANETLFRVGSVCKLFI